MAQRGIIAEIDLVELEKLCAMQATDAEIGAFFGVTERTILRRKKLPEFAEVMERGRARGRLSMRRMQMKLLEAGNATMGIWLGKQYLGQSDFGESQAQAPIVICIPKAPGTPLFLENQSDSEKVIDIGVGGDDGDDASDDEAVLDVGCQDKKHEYA